MKSQCPRFWSLPELGGLDSSSGMAVGLISSFKYKSVGHYGIHSQVPQTPKTMSEAGHPAEGLCHEAGVDAAGRPCGPQKRGGCTPAPSLAHRSCGPESPSSGPLGCPHTVLSLGSSTIGPRMRSPEHLKRTLLQYAGTCGSRELSWRSPGKGQIPRCANNSPTPPGRDG